MATTTTAHTKTISESPLRIGELEISLSGNAGIVELLIVAGAPSTGLSNFGVIAGASLIDRGVTAAVLFSAGRMRRRMGDLAVSAGTSNRAESVTSQTR